MPEINKNYNEQEHIILCANGNKEYCKKRVVPVEVEEKVIETPPEEGGGTPR